MDEEKNSWRVDVFLFLQSLLGNAPKFSLKNRLHRKLKQYYWFYCAGVAVCLLSVSSANIAVDPYGIWFSQRIWGWNWSKPKQTLHQRLFKAFDIAHQKPVGLILGSSRVLYSLSPDHPALANYQPVYNAGLSSANMYEQLRYLQHALYYQPKLKIVIVGLDFFSFNQNIKNRPDFREDRLARPLFLSKDYLITSLSLSVLGDSQETLNRNKLNPSSQPFYENGFGKYREELEQLKGSGYRLKAFEHSISSHFKSPEILGNYQISEEKLENLKQIVEICQKNNIQLKLFISPTHVADLEAISAAGLWTEFEQWKRLLVKISPVWDFSGYTPTTSEEISDQMLNYWDSHHYRRSVGDKILNVILDDSKAVSWLDRPSSPLTQKNIEYSLQKTRESQSIWRAQHQSTVQWIRALKKLHYTASNSN